MIKSTLYQLLIKTSIILQFFKEGVVLTWEIIETYIILIILYFKNFLNYRNHYLNLFIEIIEYWNKFIKYIFFIIKIRIEMENNDIIYNVY